MTVELLGLLIRHFNGEKYFYDIFMTFWVNAFLCQSKNVSLKKVLNLFFYVKIISLQMHIKIFF